MPGSDRECDEKGIPPHLHQCGRAADPEFTDPREFLYRRIPSGSEGDLTKAIQFNRMSVNRGKYCKTPDDVLWNDEAGGRHVGYRVIRFPVGALDGAWEHPQQAIAFVLRPEHKPTRCNYPHTEVVAFERGGEGNLKSLAKIKPPSVKLRIREHLRPFLTLEESG